MHGMVDASSHKLRTTVLLSSCGRSRRPRSLSSANTAATKNHSFRQRFACRCWPPDHRNNSNRAPCSTYLGGWPIFARPIVRLPHPRAFRRVGTVTMVSKGQCDPELRLCSLKYSDSVGTNDHGIEFAVPTFRRPRKVGQPRWLWYQQQESKVGQPP